MISDVLFEAKEEIERYLNDPIYNYKPIEGELLVLIEKMEEMRKKLDAVPTFDDMWKPTQVFLALRTSCKYFSGKWEEERERGQVGEPLLVFCNHPSNSSDVEGNCNEKRCPLLEDWAREQPLFEE